MPLVHSQIDIFNEDLQAPIGTPGAPWAHNTPISAPLPKVQKAV